MIILPQESALRRRRKFLTITAIALLVIFIILATNGVDLLKYWGTIGVTGAILGVLIALVDLWLVNRKKS